jgi:GxxExxY protein
MAESILKEEVYQTVGAAMEVYYQLGCGFLEPIYQQALEIEFGHRRIPFEPQQELVICYQGEILEKKYVADFICFNQIIIELKSLNGLSGREIAQLINYMKITGCMLGCSSTSAVHQDLSGNDM